MSFGRSGTLIRQRKLANDLACGRQLSRIRGGLPSRRGDAYFEYFRKRPELLEYLLEVASNVYDDDPSNVESGLNYLNAAPLERTFKTLRLEIV